MISSLGLSEHERQTHSWLSVNHVAAAHSLLKRAYPNQNGLIDTSYLADKFEWHSSTSNFVQIINVGGFHGACLSNKFTTDPNIIQLYDSLLTVPGATVKEQACTILNCKEPSFKIQVMNVFRYKSLLILAASMLLPWLLIYVPVKTLVLNYMKSLK